MKNAYLHIPIKHDHHLLNVFGKINLISGRFYHLGCPQPKGFHLTYLTCIFWPMEGFSYYYIFGSYPGFDSF